MKKLLCMLLILTLLLTMGSTAFAAAEAAEPEDILGTTEGRCYVNVFFDLALSLDKDWSISDWDDIVWDEDYETDSPLEELTQNGQVCDFAAEAKGMSSDEIEITIYDLREYFASGKKTDDLCQLFEELYGQMGGEAKRENAVFAGQECESSLIKLTLFGFTSYYRILYVIRDGFLALVTLTSDSAEGLDELAARFEQAEGFTPPEAAVETGVITQPGPGGGEWSLDLATGLLTLKGEGAMDDLFKETVEIPFGSISHIAWTDYSDRIRAVEIPEGFTTVAEFAFNDCAHLEEVRIPSTVTTIGTFAFDDCTSLKEIWLPAGLTFVDSFAFDDCDALTTVHFAGTEEQWQQIKIDFFNDPLTDAEILFEGE